MKDKQKFIAQHYAKMLLASALFFALLAFGGARQAMAAIIPEDQYSLVILAYHMIGEDRLPDQSIRNYQFKEQMRELSEDDYHVISLPDAIHHFEKEEALPPRSVVITFDGGHKSIMSQAVPILQEYGFPYTVFVSADRANMNYNNYMDWADFKYLARDKNATIGTHSASYSHIADQGREQLLRDINNARTAYREQLGIDPAFFAYPFGEYSETFRDIISEQGFKAALGQSSGVAYRGNDRLALPRFVMTEEYGDLARFRMLVNALPLPVSDVSPDISYLQERQPNIGFSVTRELNKNIGRLSCFASGQERPDIEVINGNRVELRLQQDFAQDRGRINCTMPVDSPAHEEMRWRWFGMLLAYPSTLENYTRFENTGAPDIDQK